MLCSLYFLRWVIIGDLRLIYLYLYVLLSVLNTVCVCVRPVIFCEFISHFRGSARKFMGYMAQVHWDLCLLHCVGLRLGVFSKEV